MSGGTCVATASWFCCIASWFCASAIVDEAACSPVKRLNVDGGAIDGWNSILLPRVVAPIDELRFDLRIGENGIVRCTVGGVLVGGNGTGCGGPAGTSFNRGHSGITCKGNSALDVDRRI